jgi:hypothetical protein
VKVVAHLAVGMNDEVEAIACFAQEREPGQAITIATKDTIAAVSPRCDVVEGVVELDPEWAVHGSNLYGIAEA